MIFNPIFVLIVHSLSFLSFKCCTSFIFTTVFVHSLLFIILIIPTLHRMPNHCPDHHAPSVRNHIVLICLQPYCPIWFSFVFFFRENGNSKTILTRKPRDLEEVKFNSHCEEMAIVPPRDMGALRRMFCLICYANKSGASSYNKVKALS